jgi:LPS-assembly protein
MFNASVPLIKETSESRNILEPKLSLRFSPHEMRNHKSTGSRVSTANIYGFNRLGLSDSIEDGASLTIGIDYKNQRVMH